MDFKNQKGVTTFWGISIILIEAVVVFFVFMILYFFWIENPTPTSRIFFIRAFSKKTIEIPKSVNTDGWILYSTSKYGFSLQYPEGYKISEDVIEYGTYDGLEFNLKKDDAATFSMRIFSLEQSEIVTTTFLRLTGVNPLIYQNFVEEVGGSEAIVLRMAPGQPSSDFIYFTGNNYFFESGFDELSAQILSTFKFIDL